MENNLLIEYQKKGLIGLNCLINYLGDNNSKDLLIVKKYLKEIRFWILITFFQNNHDLIDEISNQTLNDLFLMKPIQKNKTNFIYDSGEYYDYGLGIITNDDDYNKQFKLIRNLIAHNSYSLTNEGNFYFNSPNNNFLAVMDVKWFETAIMCALANRNYNFKVGLNETFFVSSLSGENISNNEKIKKGLKDHSIGVIDVLLNSNSLEKVCRVLDIVYNPNLEFYSLYYYVKNLYHEKIYRLINDKKDLSNEDFLRYVNKVISDLNTKFEGSILLKYIPIDENEVTDVINNQDFLNIDSYNDKCLCLFNHYQMERYPEIKNTLSFKIMMDILYFIENDLAISLEYQIYVKDAYILLIKSIGNLTFNSLINNMPNYRKYSDSIFENFKDKIVYDYGHAKNYYKECLKKYRNCLNDCEKYGMPNSDNFSLYNLKSRIQVLEKKLDDLKNNNNPDLFLTQLRNIFTHGNCDLKNNILLLYDQDIIRYYHRYSKNKNEWEVKKIDISPVLFNIKMPILIFNDIIKKVSDDFGVSLLDKNGNMILKV